MRGLILDLVSAALANTVLILGLTFMHISSRGVVLSAAPGRGIWLLSAVAFFSLTWFTAVQPSVLATPLLAMTGLEFGRYDQSVRPSPLRIANRITVLICLAGAALMVIRIVLALETATAGANLNSDSAPFLGPYLWAILFSVWLAIMVTLTVSARLQTDLAGARDLAEVNSLAKSQFLANMIHETRTPMNVYDPALRKAPRRQRLASGNYTPRY